jgi:hypothetical protein
MPPDIGATKYPPAKPGALGCELIISRGNPPPVLSSTPMMQVGALVGTFTNGDRMDFILFPVRSIERYNLIEIWSTDRFARSGLAETDA